MSTDARVTKDLMETLEDGRDGFNHAAEKMADNNRPDYASEFRTIAAETGLVLYRTGAVGGGLWRRHRRRRFRRRHPTPGVDVGAGNPVVRRRRGRAEDR